MLLTMYCSKSSKTSLLMMSPKLLRKRSSIASKSSKTRFESVVTRGGRGSSDHCTIFYLPGVHIQVGAFPVKVTVTVALYL